MIETILQSTNFGSNIVLVIFVGLIYQRLGRVEKDVERIASQADDYFAKIDRMEGKMAAMKRSH